MQKLFEKKLLKDFFCSCVARSFFPYYLSEKLLFEKIKEVFPWKRKWSFSKRSSIEDRFQFLSKNVLPSSRKMHWKLNLIHEDDNMKERSNWISFSKMTLYIVESSSRSVLIFLLACWLVRFFSALRNFVLTSWKGFTIKISSFQR